MWNIICEKYSCQAISEGSALLNGKPPEETAWQTMRSLGAKMTKEGNLLESDEDNIAMIHEKFLEFEQRRPQLMRLLGLEDKV